MMEHYLKIKVMLVNSNKKVLIVCASLIVLAIVSVFIINKSDEEDFYFQSDSNSYTKDYKINEIVPVYVDKETLAKKYLAEYANFMLYYPKKAYELLDDDEKESRFNDYETFLYYINDIKTIKFESASVVKYGSIKKDDKKGIYVLDSAGNKFSFWENSVMDYKVAIN